MALNQLSQRQLCYPSAASSITLTNTGSAWTSSAYSEIVASVNSSILGGICYRQASSSNDIEIDIAVGAAASEVVIGTFRIFTQSTTATNSIFRLPIGIDAIPNNSRLSARIRSSFAAATTEAIAVMLYDKPVPNSWFTSANPVAVLPPAANSIVCVAGGSTWTNGSYVQLRTNSGAALYLLAIVNGFPPTGAGNYEVDVATGGAGAETVITTIPCYSEAAGNGPGWCQLANPLDNIALNTRVAMRIRASGASGQLWLAAMVLAK